MVVLVLDAAGQQVLSLQLEPVAVAVLCTHLDGSGTGHSTVVAGEGQAALVGGLLILRNSQDLGVDEVDELVLIILGDLLGGVGGVPHHEHAAQHAHLRACQTHAVGGDHRLPHVIQQGGKAVVKVGHGAADLVQDRVALFYDIADSHSGTSKICCVVSDIPVRVQIDHNGGLAGQLFLLVEGQRFPDEVPETAVVAALDGEFIAVGIVDLFNAAGGGPSTRRGRSGCLAACRPSRAAKRAEARATSLSFGPAKPTTQSPQKADKPQLR